MALNCGFYNSNNHDRRYEAREISRLFNALIKDGVFMHVGTHMAVMESESPSMTVNIGPGLAWFDSTWSFNDALYPMKVKEADLLLTRIDALVLEIDESNAVRDNTYKFVYGVPASSPQKPTLTDTSEVHQYALCYITVRPNVTSITQSDIENNIGTESCPFVTGILETVNIDSLIAQWESQWNDWLSQQKEETDAFQQSAEEEFSQWSSEQKNLFEAWFEDVKGQLGTDPAGNLQNQINEITPHLSYQYMGLFEVGDWSEAGSTYSQTVALTALNGGPAVTENSVFKSPPMCKASTDESTNDILIDNLTMFNSGYAVLGANQVTVTLFEKPTSDMEIIWNIEEAI